MNQKLKYLVVITKYIRIIKMEGKKKNDLKKSFQRRRYGHKVLSSMKNIL